MSYEEPEGEAEEAVAVLGVPEAHGHATVTACKMWPATPAVGPSGCVNFIKFSRFVFGTAFCNSVDSLSSFRSSI
jgi:hypothetical protein